MIVLNFVNALLIMYGFLLGSCDSDVANVIFARTDPLPLTSSMNIQCRVEKDNSCDALSEVDKSCDFDIKSLTVYKGSQLIASIKKNKAPKKHNGDRNLVLTGQLSGSVDHFPYLTLDWAQPEGNIEGAYTCQAILTLINSTNTSANSEPILIVFPHHNVTLLIQQVLLMEQALNDMQAANKEMESQVTDLEQLLSTYRPVNVDFGIEELSPLGPLPLGTPQQSRTVRFRKEYHTVPQISRTIATMNVLHGKEFKLATFIRNVTTTGFQLVAYVWSDTFIDRLDISWMSIGT